ncbi:MarR family winged helix-turn-helix transcriptional regulator [Leekyejoonella antrihumi]|uniref:Winged helix-turn-helix transcriptional regulator n=1 Tax=Leekyejoonella antrihumi TaxID=1660198 RepID=A0A563E8Z0_9MICO|nr:MarR family winged helix-turn-helix transcriptional regulator [Leekyejoonella antrihumi]TWP38967.1 winged helix-turn-helix transcriptional regulator [Leekyejoonella antrihumi]
MIARNSQPPPTAPVGAVVQDLEYELTVLSRHYVHTRKNRPHQLLDLSAYVLLSRLELESPMSLKELAAAFRLDLSTINRQVGALVRKQLVDYVLDPEGGVARKVQPTDLGLEQLHTDRTQSAQGLTHVVEGWTGEDRDRLCNLLTRFNQDIERLEGVPWPRPER